MISVDPSGMVCYRCHRNIGEPWDSIIFHSAQHSFIWCDEGKLGYQDTDPLIGYGPHKGDGGLCTDVDRKWMKDEKLKKKDNLWCEALPDNLTECLKKRIRKELYTPCYGTYKPYANDCNDYADNMIGVCTPDVIEKR